MGCDRNRSGSQAQKEATEKLMAVCEYPAGGELCLSMCVAVSSVLNRSGAGLSANDLRGFSAELSGAIETQLQYMRTAHHAGEEVQPFVDQLCAKLESISNEVPGARAQKVAASLVSQLRAAIAAALERPPPVCGCCLFALEITNDAYRKYVGKARPKVGFAIRAAESDLSWHGVQSKIAGTTTLQERPGKTNVGLTLSLRLPWHDAFEAIPYVLAHECVAHAFRGPHDSTEDTGQGSEFAEGWMDRVAVLLLLHAVRSGAASTLPWPWNAVADIGIRVGTAHRERLAPRDPDPHDRLRSKWAVGLEAALALENLIRHILGDTPPTLAQKEFLRLSLLLNASEISPATRDHLARKLYITQADELQSQVRTWLADGLPPPSLLRD
jgi:hypothetical protein